MPILQDEEETPYNPDEIIQFHEAILHGSYGNNSGNIDMTKQSLLHSGEEMHTLEERESRLSYSSAISTMVHPNNSAYLTTFLLLNTMIGSGILNQPYVFYQSGLLGGIIGFAIASYATWYGLLVLTGAGIYCNVLEFSDLARHAYGKTGELLVDWSIVITSFGSQLAYILVVGTTLSDLFYSWGCDSVACNDYFTTIIAVAVLVTPVCMFRHFGHLAFLSLYSIGCIVAVLVLVWVGGPIKHVTEHMPSNYTVLSPLGMLSSAGSIVFSLSCATANFQGYISTEKKSRNMESWHKITGAAVGVGTLMCMGMGIVGYLCFGDNTQGMILDNFPQHGYDFFKIMVVSHLVLYIPVNFVIMRYSLVKIWTGMRSELLPFWSHSAVTVGLQAAVTAVVILLLSLGLASGVAFSLILDVTGGIGGSLSTQIIPALIYLKVMPKDSPLYTHARVLLVLGYLTMIVVVAAIIIQYSS